MSLFEYVMLLVSVVLSLGIARLLESHAHLLRIGGAVRWSPTYLLWLFLIFAIHVDLWASLWSMREASTWSLPSLIATLLAAVFLFYAAVLSSPSLASDEPIDLWEFHIAQRQRYVSALAAYLVMGAILNSFVLAGFSAATITATLPGLFLCALAVFVRNRWVQIFTPIAIGVLLAIYFVQFFSSFRG